MLLESLAAVNICLCFCSLCSVYEKTPNEHLISGVTGQRTVSLQKTNLPDTGMHSSIAIPYSGWCSGLVVLEL